jgi:hypothetical protein
LFTHFIAFSIGAALKLRKKARQRQALTISRLVLERQGLAPRLDKLESARDPIIGQNIESYAARYIHPVKQYW